ncbi:MAG: hypothetical protein ACREDJ_05570, partial [Methylocella sp.]
MIVDCFGENGYKSSLHSIIWVTRSISLGPMVVPLFEVLRHSAMNYRQTARIAAPLSLQKIGYVFAIRRQAGERLAHSFKIN